jgi:hypothetical protein
MKSRLTLGNACYHAVQNILSSHQLPENIKIKDIQNSNFACSYRCETWSVTLSEEHRRRVFENRALRRIFGPKRDKMTGGWRRLHNEGPHSPCYSPVIIRLIKWVRCVV